MRLSAEPGEDHSDRTGHKSSRQIHHYKRAARKVAELGLGDFAPLDEANPELNGRGGRLGGSDPILRPDVSEILAG
ncbi:uncharacterized protein SOCE836_028540 [Sorangium cellulosum]|uniref:Uncharacterized protein n=1 Tax=Sorangium cellulosum TaxID=56 RepID=A0A4P2QMK1_SORCE|nr:uncharacterized protein SOCE836_028540 [Sorangium cellulosum]WCQ90124.1 hypothetical protein NQZ70_02825 [Sorangium sp. Soce836]